MLGRYLLFGGLWFLLAGAGTPDNSVTVEDVIKILREFGFPIFVCLWFMWRVEKKLDAFTSNIDKLYRIVIVMAKVLDAQDDEQAVPKAIAGAKP